MSKLRISVLLNVFLWVAAPAVHAQFRLPAMDIQVKSGIALIEDMRDKYSNIYQYLAPNLHAEINLHISQYFAVGAFISDGIYFPSQVEFESDPGSTTSYNAAHHLYGVKIRLSTGRQPRFRPFVELQYGKFEMNIEKELYRVATSTTFFGGSLGLMIRLNNKFYLVLPQVTVRPRSDPFFFEVPGDFALGPYAPLIEITGGISYNFGKKK